MKKNGMKKPLVKAKVKYVMTSLRAEKMRKNELNSEEAQQLAEEYTKLSA